MVFYKPFHKTLAVWLGSQWVSSQKLPERSFQESKLIQKYLNSEVIKSLTTACCVVAFSLLVRDTVNLQNSLQTHEQILTPIAPQIMDLSSSRLMLEQRKKLEEAEQQLASLKLEVQKQKAKDREDQAMVKKMQTLLQEQRHTVSEAPKPKNI